MRATGLYDSGPVRFGQECILDLKNGAIGYLTAVEAAIDPRTKIKLRYNGSCGDLDASLKTLITNYLAVTVNCGVVTPEVQETAKKEEPSESCYFGIHLDFKL